MNSLLKLIKKSPSNISLIKDLESKIKNNWKVYCNDKPFDHTTFIDSFSELLVKLDSISNFQSLVRTFSSIYYTRYESNLKRLSVIEEFSCEDDDEVVKLSKINFNNFTPSDYILFYNFIKDIKKEDRKLISTASTLSMLTKVSCSPSLDKNSFTDIVNNINFSNMFLINELGLKKYLGFTKLMNLLGMYYPLSSITDTKLSMKLKEEIINKFLLTIDNANISDLSTIEKLVY